MIRVQPRARHSELAGRHGEAVKIRIAAPAAEGAANAELLRFLADLLDVSRSALSIASGAGSRNKVVMVTGISQAVARARLGLDR